MFKNPKSESSKTCGLNGSHFLGVVLISKLRVIIIYQLRLLSSMEEEQELKKQWT